MPIAIPVSAPPVNAVTVPVNVTAAPTCRYLSQAEAQVAFDRLRAMLPSTRFESAAPSEVCGLAFLKLANGATAYTDATGRYFLLAFALDTHRGSPADNGQTIEGQIEKRQTVPGGMPGFNPVQDAPAP